jgi:hypothetical protein
MVSRVTNLLFRNHFLQIAQSRADRAVRAGLEDGGRALRKGVVGTELGAHEEGYGHQAVDSSTKIPDSCAAGLRKNWAR